MFEFFLSTLAVCYLHEYRGWSSLVWPAGCLLVALALQFAVSPHAWIQVVAGLPAGAVAAWLVKRLTRRRGSLVPPDLPVWRFALALLYVVIAQLLYPYRATTLGLRGRSVADQVGMLTCVLLWFAVAYLDAWLCRHPAEDLLLTSHLAPPWMAFFSAWLEMLIRAARGRGGTDTGESVSLLAVMGSVGLAVMLASLVLPQW